MWAGFSVISIFEICFLIFDIAIAIKNIFKNFFDPMKIQSVHTEDEKMQANIKFQMKIQKLEKHIKVR